MSDLVQFDSVEQKIVTLRGISVILDSDVAQLYGVETKEVNQAVKNNPDKFPASYIFATSKEEKNELVKNFDRFVKLKHSTTTPTAFTEKGLYMLATILKGEKATQTTISIVETFAKVRELGRNVAQLANPMPEPKQKTLMAKTGGLIAEILGNDMQTSGAETTLELNLAILKVKHTVHRQSSSKKKK